MEENKTPVDGENAAAEEKAAKKEKKADKKELLARIEELEKELFGPAASDYVSAAEIETRRAEIEEELLALYDLTMS